MSKVLVLYGSTVGNTRFVAEKIAKQIEGAKVFSVKEVDEVMLMSCKKLIIGTSTWGIGSFQDDFYAFENLLLMCDLSQHQAALFGLGDQFNYPDSFCDGMGRVYDVLKAQGCVLFGKWPTEDYNFSESKAMRNDELVGLALDEDNEPDLTNYRIKTWLALIAKPMGLEFRL